MASFEFDDSITVLSSEVVTTDATEIGGTAKPPAPGQAQLLISQFAKRAATVRNPSHAGNVSAKERANQFPGTTYEDGGKLFCVACNLVLDHTRKSSIDTHMATSKHLAKIEQKTTSDTGCKKQKTLTTCFKTATVAQVERVEVRLIIKISS